MGGALGADRVALKAGGGLEELLGGSGAWQEGWGLAGAWSSQEAWGAPVLWQGGFRVLGVTGSCGWQGDFGRLSEGFWGTVGGLG